ncbi:MAG: hypothetical protein EA376_07605 [Phycisphaeraceae bacterium]|nr:MAG: hypothetical protein EA376_07605 [Phycisphaeraceae bacterium]
MTRKHNTTRGQSRLALGPLLCFAAAALSGCAAPSTTPQQGRLLITLEDPTTSPEAFVGLSGGEVERHDVGGLTIFDLPLPDPADEAALVNYQQVTVSNSALRAQGAVALSPNGRFALVAGDEGVTLVDLQGPAARIVGAVEVGGTPVSVAFHPEGRLAAALSAEDASLRLLEVSAEGVRVLESWPLGWSLGDDAAPSSIAWHPGGYFIGLTLPGRNQAAFLEFQERSGAYTVRPWGRATPTGRRPVQGMWSPDGRFFITADRRWSDADEGVRVYQGGGSITVIRVSDTIDLGGDLGHDRADRMTLPLAPDAIAISPDGRRLVIASRRADDVGRPGAEREGGRLTLLGFDRARGGLTGLDEKRAGSLASALAFDPAGRTLFVTDLGNSEVQMWRIDRERLVYTGVNITTGRSPHGVVVAP